MTIQRWKPEALKQKRLSQEEVQKIQELKEQGKTQREIAEELGVSQQAVSKNTTSDTCPKLSTPSPSNVIPSPVKFQKQEPADDYDEEDEEDFDDLSIKAEDPGKIVVNPINWKERGNKFVEAMITASAFSKAIEIDSHGGFPDNMKEVFSEAILLMKKNLPQFIEYFVTTNSLERR
jgi:DNA-binding XRE family transcriptional regulator